MPFIRRTRDPDAARRHQGGAKPTDAHPATGAQATSAPPATAAGPQADDGDAARKRRRAIGAVLALGATGATLVGCGATGQHPQLQAREKGTSISADPLDPHTTADLPADPRDLVVTVPSPTDVPPHVTTTTAPPAWAERGPVQPALDGAFAVAGHQTRALAPGVHHHALTGQMGGRAQVVHVVEIDLTRPEYDVTSNRSEDRALTVSQWAERTRPVVVINADFFDMATRQPRGLAIADGAQWPGTGDLPDHTVMGCTAEQVCTFDAENEVKHDPAWQDAVGMNGARLIVDGAVRVHPGAFYETDRHPRSAVALTDDNRMLFFAIEGRLGDAAGATWNETAQLVSRFGNVVQAGMLDGGGSTTLGHVDDAGVVHRLNRVPGGAERPVANVLAIRDMARG